MDSNPNASFRKGALARVLRPGWVWHSWDEHRNRAWRADLARSAAACSSNSERLSVLFDSTGEPRSSPGGEWVYLTAGHIVHIVKGQAPCPEFRAGRKWGLPGSTVLVFDYTSGRELYVPRRDLEPAR
jgi:hypothetical protein